MSRTLAAALAAAFLAPAAHAQSFTDEARVLEARPIVERIPIKREECWNERVRAYENRTVTRQDTGQPLGAGAVLGGIVGGVLGHQVGSGRGNTAATVAGAIGGALAGNEIERRNREGAVVTEVERVPVERDVQRCRMVDEVREVTAAWDVRYVYNNREFSTRMPFDPGRRLTIAVNVKPIEDRPAPPPRSGPPPRPSQPRY
jgi:uncharacterized protein YcfJ